MRMVDTGAVRRRYRLPRAGVRRRDIAVDQRAARKARGVLDFAYIMQARELLPAQANTSEVFKLARELRHLAHVRNALTGVIVKRSQQYHVTHPVVAPTPEMKKVAVKTLRQPFSRSTSVISTGVQSTV